VPQTGLVNTEGDANARSTSASVSACARLVRVGVPSSLVVIILAARRRREMSKKAGLPPSL